MSLVVAVFVVVPLLELPLLELLPELLLELLLLEEDEEEDEELLLDDELLPLLPFDELPDECVLLAFITEQ